MLWQRRTISTQENVGEPAELPASIRGLPAKALADLTQIFPEVVLEELGLEDTGFFPYEPLSPVEVVPMYKVEKYLIKKGMLAQVEAALEALPGQNGELARVDWKRAPNLVKNSPLVRGIAAALDISDEMLDVMVREANALP